MAVPHIELCKAAAHLRECGECADEIGRILKQELAVLQLPIAPSSDVNEDGFPVEIPMTSHADVPNAVDHPAEKAGECGICIATTRKLGQRPTTPAAILTQLETL